MKQRPLLPQLLLVFLISGPRLSFPLVFYISLISDCGSCFVFFSQTSQVYPASSYPLFCRHKHTDPLLPHTLSGIHTEYLDYINPSTFIAAFKNILFNIQKKIQKKLQYLQFLQFLQSKDETLSFFCKSFKIFFFPQRKFSQQSWVSPSGIRNITSRPFVSKYVNIPALSILHKWQ